jgi:hypothetical protein
MSFIQYVDSIYVAYKQQEVFIGSRGLQYPDRPQSASQSYELFQLKSGAISLQHDKVYSYIATRFMPANGAR